MDSTLNGILNIDKPPGMTSFGVVAMVKRLTGEKRVGHTGTLDPDATGVLPVCLGQGTRIIEFFVDTAKTYRAVIELGIATDTYDSGGRVTQRVDPSAVDCAGLESALALFRGAIRQTPPMYSAVKHRGQPLYKLARAGISIERKSRPVTIHRLELVAWQPPSATLEIECSKGTYIRSLVHDLGQTLGCGAHLESLMRTRCGIFDIGDAISLPRLEEAFRGGYGENYLHPVDVVLRDYDAVVLDDVAEAALRNGSPVNIPGSHKPEIHAYCRAYSQDGRFLGMLRYIPEKESWQPKKVLI
jgi:tRNA pseudouridine55 synthase